MSPTMPRFALAARVIHWIMAVMILAMLFIGIGMVSTVGELYSRLIAIHRPLGIAILAFAILRLVVRFTNKPPPLPADLPMIQKLAAHGSHLALYALMIAMPLVGWGMLSAGGYPIVMASGFHLPPILPHDLFLYGLLRQAHTWLALALFAVFLAHLAAALMHGLIRQDGVFSSMASFGRRGGV
ncbi:cytochrome b [Caulobacter sp. S45]|uniref:cytochrome b n=1 Tax=Caulobacter sp. S45 TaxID=1641861 RepID=UPI00131DD63A|nr:cytochrome b [Caulobacter sp. S45]